ncbi:hypothetical protein LCGC14_0209660 [marine sediment metagenome]|uniref:Uncharacterized protein n=1 Tax=marine sediment metagenome TaxID=412755 RepID=A0A0F9UGX8_9ZZZZ
MMHDSLIRELLMGVKWFSRGIDYWQDVRLCIAGVREQQLALAYRNREVCLSQLRVLRGWV